MLKVFIKLKNTMSVQNYASGLTYCLKVDGNYIERIVIIRAIFSDLKNLII